MLLIRPDDDASQPCRCFNSLFFASIYNALLTFPTKFIKSIFKAMKFSSVSWPFYISKAVAFLPLHFSKIAYSVYDLICILIKILHRY